MYHRHSLRHSNLRFYTVSPSKETEIVMSRVKIHQIKETNELEVMECT